MIDPDTCRPLAQLRADGNEVRFIVQAEGQLVAETGSWLAPLETLPDDSLELSETDRCATRVVAIPPPDGNGERPTGSLYFVSHDGYEIWTVGADGSDLRRLTDLPGAIESVDWSHDGHGVVFDYFDEVTGPEVRHLDLEAGATKTLVDGASLPAWRPGTDRIAFLAGESDRAGVPIDAVAPDGSGRRTIAQTGGEFVWSPDGSRLAYVVGGPATGELFVSLADGTGRERLGGEHIRATETAWSPDGTRLAFAGAEIGSTYEDMYMADLGMGTSRVVYSSTGFEFGPDWSPDGGSIAFVSFGQHIHEVLVSNPDGGDPVVIAESDGFASPGRPHWSPDGEWIAYPRRSAGEIFDIHIVRPDGSDDRIVARGLHSQPSLGWVPAP